MISLCGIDTHAESAALKHRISSTKHQQLAAFRQKKNALHYVTRLNKSGVKAVIGKKRVKGTAVYQVFANPSKPNIRLASLEATPATLLPVKTVPDRLSHDIPGKNRGDAAYAAAAVTSAPGDKQNSGAAANGPRAKVQPPAGESEFNDGKEVEVAKFESREEAVRFSNDVSGAGHITVIRPETTKEGKTVYRVLIVVHGTEAGQSAGSFLPGTKPPGAEEPVGTVREPGGIFGQTGRNVHGAASLAALFTDNAFSTPDNRKSGYALVFTPEIWFLLPRYYEQPLPFADTSIRTPGGLIVTRMKPEVMRRYYTFFSYKADIPLIWNNYPSGSTVAHDARARFIYNFGGDLYLDLIDQFSRSFETRATNVAVRPSEVDRFKSNLFNAIGYYDAGSRFRLRLDYSNFYLSFDDPINSFRDRMDNALSGYIFYKLQPKTSAFIQYTFTDVHYEHNAELDSHEQLVAAGLQWDITAKSSGIVKAGYEIKDFYNLDQTVNNYILELQARHKFNPRNYLTLTGFRHTNETDISVSDYIVTYGLKLDYQHLFSRKLSGFAGFQYARDSYRNFLTDSLVQVEDNTYQAVASLQYNFRRWLRTSLSYTYMQRDSNIPEFNFTSNTVIVRVNAIF